MIVSDTGLPIRVSAVSFLNTAPLIWGLLHGPQQGSFDLRFELPSACADSLAAQTADIGLIPCIEAERQNLEVVSSLGIAAEGPVRSILLVSKVPFRQITSVAMDQSSRTSVALTRIILAERYGIQEPKTVVLPPDVDSMLQAADAALVIGDPALQYDLETSPYLVLDLAQEWYELTKLPMVFAVWAGRPGNKKAEIEKTLEDSYQYGKNHLEEIIHKEGDPRGIPRVLALQYFTRYLVYELENRHYQGMQQFLAYAHRLRLAPKRFDTVTL